MDPRTERKDHMAPLRATGIPGRFCVECGCKSCGQGPYFVDCEDFLADSERHTEALDEDDYRVGGEFRRVFWDHEGVERAVAVRYYRSRWVARRVHI